MKPLIKSKKDIQRIPMYIEGLDENIEGGIPMEQIVLVSGTSGTMKSSLVFNVFYNEVLKRKRCGLYISLEQSAYSFLNHMINLGFDLDKIDYIVMEDISKLTDVLTKVKSAKDGVLVLLDIGAVRKQLKEVTETPGGDWLNVIKNIIKRFKKTTEKCDLFCLDSITALYVLSEFKNPRTTLFHIFEFLRDMGMTSYIVSEMPVDKNKYATYEVEDFLADAVIKLEVTPRQRKVTREISVVKMRTTKCSLDIFTLEFERGKFKALYGGQTPLV